MILNCSHLAEYQAECGHIFCGWCMAKADLSTDATERLFSYLVPNCTHPINLDLFTNLSTCQALSYSQIKEEVTSTAKKCHLVAAYACCCIGMLSILSLSVIFKT